MTRWRPQVRPLHRPLKLIDTEGPPDRRRDPLGKRTSDEPCGFDSRPFRLGPGEPRAGLADGVRGVAEACETVNLEAPGSTPAEYPRSIDRMIGVCSWESSEFPKLADRVQILAPLLLSADVAER